VKGGASTGLVDEVAYIHQLRRNREEVRRHTDDGSGNEPDDDGDGDRDSWNTERNLIISQHRHIM